MWDGGELRFCGGNFGGIEKEHEFEERI